jgi:hypothetical protein
MGLLGGPVDAGEKQRLVEASIARNIEKYPLFSANKIKYGPDLPMHEGSILETQGPGATDQYGNILNNTDGYLINVGDINDDRIKGNLDTALLGDMLHTLRGNPEWTKMTNDVYGMRDEWQRNNDMDAYYKTLYDNYNGDAKQYPLQKFEDYHRKDAYTRSVIAADNNAEQWTNAAQEKYIKDNMLPYLSSPVGLLNE